MGWLVLLAVSGLVIWRLRQPRMSDAEFARRVQYTREQVRERRRRSEDLH